MVIFLVLCGPKDSDSCFKRIKCSKASPQTPPLRALHTGPNPSTWNPPSGHAWAWEPPLPTGGRWEWEDPVGHLVTRMSFLNQKKGSRTACVHRLFRKFSLLEYTRVPQLFSVVENVPFAWKFLFPCLVMVLSANLDLSSNVSSGKVFTD